MFHIVLFEPEIPPNTGNIIRLCANSGQKLHLIQPLGFSLDEKSLRRAGLDYHAQTCMTVHASYADFINTVQPQRVWGISTKGHTCYSKVAFQAGDALVFGPETRGLPQTMLDDIGLHACLRIPMVAGSRSLNLANAVGIVVYEAWRQFSFGE